MSDHLFGCDTCGKFLVLGSFEHRTHACARPTPTAPAMSNTKEPMPHKDATQGLCDMTDPKTPTAPVADEELARVAEAYVRAKYPWCPHQATEADDSIVDMNTPTRREALEDFMAGAEAGARKQAAQIAELERKLGEEARLHKVYEDTAEDFGEQLIALRAENRKYREALEKITAPAPLIGSGKTAASQYRAIASEALSMGSGEKKV